MELPCFFWLRMHDKNIEHETDIVAPLQSPKMVKVKNTSPTIRDDTDS